MEGTEAFNGGDLGGDNFYGEADERRMESTSGKRLLCGVHIQTQTQIYINTHTHTLI